MRMNFKCDFIREAPLKSPWEDIFSTWASYLAPKLVFLFPKRSNFHYYSLPPTKWYWMGMKIQEGKWTLQDKLKLPREWTMIFFTNSFPLPPYMTNYQTSRKRLENHVGAQWLELKVGSLILINPIFEVFLWIYAFGYKSPLFSL